MNNNSSLITDKRFWPTFWTQFLGAFNDNVFKNALVILITYRSFTLAGLDPKLMVAAAGGIFILPFFLFSATAGQICDKYPKHKLMFWIKVWEVVVMLIGAFGFITENVLVLMITLFFMGLQSTFFGPVKYSILPELIKENELVEGNANFQMGTFVSILMGTILGGVLIGIEGNGSLIVAITVVVLASLGVWTSAKMHPLDSNDDSIKVDWLIVKPTWDIIKLTAEIKSVFLGVFGISWFWFFGACLLTLFPLYGKNVLSGNEHVVTLFLALFSIGVAVGSIICEKMSHKKLEVGLVPLGAIGLSVFTLDLFFVGQPEYAVSATQLLTLGEFLAKPVALRIVADLSLISVFSGFYIVPLYTLIQQRSRPEVRSRIIAGNNIYNAIFMVVASIMLMVVMGKGMSVPQIFLLLSVLNIIVCLIMFKSSDEYLIRFKALFFTKKKSKQ